MADGFFDVPNVPYHKLNKFTEYKKFEEKFEPKKTTDDCYTPEPVYKAIKDWVFKRWNLPQDTQIIRPFYPGRNFENEEYPEGCLVLDNPPFSLYAHIVRWYLSKGVRFFIFGPYLSGLVIGADVTYIVAGKQITYTNGANVATCFCTNLPSDARLICSTDLYHAIDDANTGAKPSRVVRKLEWPPSILNMARTGTLVRGDFPEGHEFHIYKDECAYIRKMDCGQDIFGNGLILADSAVERFKKEKEDVDKLSNDRCIAHVLESWDTYCETISLSEREQEIQQNLTNQANANRAAAIKELSK